jgi:serine/threonine-protein kinase RsbT
MRKLIAKKKTNMKKQRKKPDASQTVFVSKETDIALAVTAVINKSMEIGFKSTEHCMVGTSVSELARNIVRYAKKGRITFKAISRKDQKGIEIAAIDRGPGIKDIKLAMQDHYTTFSGSLGVGLPGVKRLMDEFSIEAKNGTKIVTRKWVH